MKLEELFSPGSHLSDIPPDFHGMPLKEWETAQKLAQITLQCSAYVKTLDPEDAPLSRKAIHTKRDDYGLKSG